VGFARTMKGSSGNEEEDTYIYMIGRRILRAWKVAVVMRRRILSYWQEGGGILTYMSCCRSQWGGGYLHIHNKEEDTYIYIIWRRILTFMKGSSCNEEEDTYIYIINGFRESTTICQSKLHAKWGGGYFYIQNKEAETRISWVYDKIPK
jgi:hypothetical protein